MSSENKPVMPPERIEETETEEEIRREEAAKGKGERAFEVYIWRNRLYRQRSW